LTDKKSFANFLDRFEDEESRSKAREQLQKLTFKQKERSVANWSQKRASEEAERRSKLEEIEREKRRLEQEMRRREEEAIRLR